MIDRRCVLSLSAAAFLTSFLPARADAPVATTFDAEAFKATLASGRPMLVEITASWCPTCRAQRAVFADLLQEPRFADLTIYEVDFDSRKDVVRAFGARQQSTLIVFAGGKEVGRSVGETRPAHIAALLDSAY